eukprot:TRINITY_DN7675_c0_g1_i1.p1 TRINITY_DN7675_c0_g1~~TRINITY_DN7675_c0_g1_i1.p1  ORF type:complete len:390 (+),score=72.44 TRINITY_DN7675_c0_g1_i1:909-2078(+)
MRNTSPVSTSPIAGSSRSPLGSPKLEALSLEPHSPRLSESLVQDFIDFSLKEEERPTRQFQTQEYKEFSKELGRRNSKEVKSKKNVASSTPKKSDVQMGSVPDAPKLTPPKTLGSSNLVSDAPKISSSKSPSSEITKPQPKQDEPKIPESAKTETPSRSSPPKTPTPSTPPPPSTKTFKLNPFAEEFTPRSAPKARPQHSPDLDISQEYAQVMSTKQQISSSLISSQWPSGSQSSYKQMIPEENIPCYYDPSQNVPVSPPHHRVITMPYPPPPVQQHVIGGPYGPQPGVVYTAPSHHPQSVFMGVQPGFGPPVINAPNPHFHPRDLRQRYGSHAKQTYHHYTPSIPHNGAKNDYVFLVQGNPGFIQQPFPGHYPGSHQQQPGPYQHFRP